MIIDSHCHLLHKNNEKSLDEIILNAKKSGVEKFLNISTCEDEFKPILKTSDNNKNVFSTLGIHPHEANNMTIEIKNTITKLSSNKKVIGIGETGLDFYYENSNKENQIKSFIMHIEISQELGLPLVIHMRNAENETIDIIKTHYKKKEFYRSLEDYTPVKKNIESKEVILNSGINLYALK